MNAIIALMVIINIHLSGQVGDRKDGDQIFSLVFSCNIKTFRVFIHMTLCPLGDDH